MCVYTRMHAQPNMPTILHYVSLKSILVFFFSKDAGVVGTCGELCQMLEDKVNSSIVGVVCNLLCDYVGIREFIKIIEK